MKVDLKKLAKLYPSEVRGLMDAMDVDRQLAKVRRELRRLPRAQRPAPTSLSIAEAARRLGISKSELGRHLACGRLFSFRLGKHRRIAISSVERFEQEQRAANERAA